MNTWTYLSQMPDLFWPCVLTAAAVGVLGAALSGLVVLKRLAFVGQGISHAAFGGVGLAVTMGVLGATAAEALANYGIVLVFCLAAAVLMGRLSRRGKTQADTAIGIVLVAAMALGALLLARARSTVSWESFLFGSIMSVSWIDAAIASGVTLATLIVLFVVRRPLLLWAFDPGMASACGVRAGLMELVLMTLLALATVTTMKLAGVVLATALLVLPGATALRLTVRSTSVLALSLAAAMVGVLGGLVLSFELNWPPGPSVVLVLTSEFALAALWARVNAGGRPYAAVGGAR